MKKRGSSSWVWLALVVALGCSGSESGPGSGRNNGGNSGADAANGGSGGASGNSGGNAGSSGALANAGTTGSNDDIDAGEDTDPDNDLCGTETIETTVERSEVPGNVLVVYDKSGSMKEPWNLPDGTPSTKLLASAKAFLDALGPIATKVNVGTIFFPSSGGGSSCTVDPLDSVNQIPMMAGPDYLTAWGVYWMGKDATGSTPLLQGLMAADAAITASTLEGTTVVLVITDGDPKCNWDATMGNGLASKWLAAGIKTHVVGLPGTTGTGDATLTALAVAGGTTTFIKPEDSMKLQTEIAKIATETVTTKLDSCTIKLEPPPPDPDKVQMVAVENGMKASVPRVINDDAGWSINADGSRVELEGLLCRDAKAGRFTKLTFQYGCKELPPIEPPMVE